MISPRYRAAFEFAATKHRDQLRKDTQIPYLSHLMSVSALVMEVRDDEDLWIAALLHDTVEDGGGLPVADEIRALFGRRVAEIVLACSDSTAGDPHNKTDWRPRKERYLAHLRTAHDDVRLVSCADKLHNARCILADFRVLGGALWSRFTPSGRDTLWYYETLVEAFAQGVEPPHLDELRRTLAQLRALVGGTPQS